MRRATALLTAALAVVVCGSSASAGEPRGKDNKKGRPTEIEIDCLEEGSEVEIVISTDETPKDSDKDGTTDLARIFRMGARLHLGAFDVPRTAEASQNSGFAAGVSAVFDFPTLFTEWWGLEVSIGAGLYYFPELSDVLVDNLLELDFVFKLHEKWRLAVGYRASGLVDLDQTFGNGHYGVLGVRFQVNKSFEIMVAGIIGRKVMAWKKKTSISNGELKLEGIEITHHWGTSWKLELGITWRFW